MDVGPSSRTEWRTPRRTQNWSHCAGLSQSRLQLLDSSRAESFVSCAILSILFVGFSGSLTAANAQDDLADARIQEITQLLESTRENRVELLLELVDLQKSDSALVLEKTDEILRLAKKTEDPIAEGQARTHRSWAYQVKGEYESAKQEATDALRLLDGDEKLTAKAHYMKSVAHWRMAEQESALEHALRARDLRQKFGNSEELSEAMTLLGAIYRSHGDFEQSLDSHLHALRISTEDNDDAGIARSENNLGLLYWKLGHYDEAYARIGQAMEVYKRLERPSQVATCSSNMGLILVALERPKDALPFLQKALAQRIAEKDRHGRAKALSNFAYAYSELGDNEKSLEYHAEALAIRKSLRDKIGVIRTQGSIAKVLDETDKSVEAIKLLEESLALAIEVEARSEESAIHGLLSGVYRNLGDTAKALEHSEIHHELEADLASLELKERISELEVSAQVVRREQEIDELNYVAEQRRSSNLWLTLVSGILATSVIVVGILLVARSRTLRLMQEANDELLRTSNRLGESEARYKTLFESADIPTFLVDPRSQRVIDLNLAAKESCGVTLEPGGIEVGELRPRSVCDAIRKTVMQDQLDSYAHEESWSDLNGRPRWMQVRGYSVTVEGRDSVLVSIRDTTEERAQENARIRADRLDSLGVLAGGIAHDFNNSLTAITGFLTLAKDERSPDEDDPVEMAQTAVNQASRLTKQLLTFSKGGAPVLKVHDIGELLRDAVQLASAGSNMHVEFEIPADLWCARVDSGQFTQVVSNLVINAEQAIKEERGMLEVRASNVVRDSGLQPDASECRDYVRIDFMDNGEGISAEAKEYVFDPYFTTKPNGTGLGLTTAYAIMKRHGGDIGIASNGSHGTRFSLEFPATRIRAEASKLPKSIPSGVGSILLLEDEPFVRKAAALLLERCGYQVVAVADGYDAIETYRTKLKAGEPFDALLLDLTIPGGLGGCEVVAQISSFDPEVKAIACSGYCVNPVIANYKEAGFVAALPKPFQLEELASTVQDAIRKRRKAWQLDQTDAS